MGVAGEARGDKHLPLVMMNSISASPLMDEAAPTCRLLSESQFGKWMAVVRQSPTSPLCFITSLNAHKLCVPGQTYINIHFNQQLIYDIFFAELLRMAKMNSQNHQSVLSCCYFLYRIFSELKGPT